MRRLVCDQWSIQGMCVFVCYCVHVCRSGAIIAGGLALTPLCVLIQHRGRVSGGQRVYWGEGDVVVITGGDLGVRGRRVGRVQRGWSVHMPQGR